MSTLKPLPEKLGRYLRHVLCAARLTVLQCRCPGTNRDPGATRRAVPCRAPQDMLTLTTRMNALARITLGNVNISATTALQVGLGGLSCMLCFARVEIRFRVRVGGGDEHPGDS